MCVSHVGKKARQVLKILMGRASTDAVLHCARKANWKGVAHWQGPVVARSQPARLPPGTSVLNQETPGVTTPVTAERQRTLQVCWKLCRKLAGIEKMSAASVDSSVAGRILVRSAAARL